MLDLSIVLVNWNTRDRLAACLGAIEATAGDLALEIFVVDNASQDGSAEMVRRRFPAVRLIANDHNLGFSAGNNQALREAAGRYVLLLNPDTEVQPGALAALRDFMEAHPEAGLCGAKLLQPDGRLYPACKRSIPTPAVALWRALGLSRLFPKHKEFGKYNLSFLDPDEVHAVEAVSGACMFARKSAVDQVGLLDERFFMYGEDLDWCLRISQAGWKIYYVPQAQIVHYFGSGSRQRRLKSTLNFYQAMYLFHRKHFARRMNPLANGAVVAGIVAGAVGSLCLSMVRGGGGRTGVGGPSPS